MSFIEIQRKIAAFMEKATEVHNVHSVAQKRATLLHDAGFTKSPSAKKDEQLNRLILKSNLSSVFGNKPILLREEIDYFLKKYKLEMHPVKYYNQVVPSENADDIINFTNTTRLLKWNHGSHQNYLHFIPINTEFLMIAPRELFDHKKIEFDKELKKNRERLERLRKEDPIVLKQIWVFDPANRENRRTDMYIVVTAWGVEAILAEEEDMI